MNETIVSFRVALSSLLRAIYVDNSNDKSSFGTNYFLLIGLMKPHSPAFVLRDDVILRIGCFVLT